MKLKYICILSILLSNIPSFAQTFTKKELQAVNQQTDSVLNLYMKYANFSVDGASVSEWYISGFKALFTSTKAVILNDIDLHEQNPGDVTVENYVTNVKKWYAGGLVTGLENITKGTPVRKNSRIELEVDAQKSILGYYMDKERFDKTFNIKFFLSFDNSLKKASIARISRPEIAKDSLEYKLLIREADNLFSKQDFEGAKKRYEQSLLIFSKATYPVDQIQKSEKAIVKQKYDKRKPLYLLVNVQPGFNSLSFTSKSEGTSPTSSSAIGIAGGIGIEMDLIKNKSRKFYGGIGLGITYSTVEIKVKSKTILDTVRNQTDIDNESYNLIVSVKGLEEKLKLTYLDIPLYFQMKYFISKSVSLKFKIGAIMGIPLSKQYESTGYSEYKGQYPQYNNIILYGNLLSAYGFGTDSTSYKGSNSALQQISISGMAALGVGFKINSTFSLFGNIQYTMGVADIFKPVTANYHISHKKGSLNSISGFLNGNNSTLGIELGVTMRIY